jgi:hypothetical protein
VNPRVRGIWLREAMGQTLRHRAGAIRNTNGRSGTNKPQKMNNPRGGLRTLTATRPNAQATPNQRRSLQTRGGTRSGISVYTSKRRALGITSYAIFEKMAASHHSQAAI